MCRALKLLYSYGDAGLIYYRIQQGHHCTTIGTVIGRPASFGSKKLASENATYVAPNIP